jgi:hypothetical protein
MFSTKEMPHVPGLQDEKEPAGETVLLYRRTLKQALRPHGGDRIAANGLGQIQPRRDELWTSSCPWPTVTGRNKKALDLLTIHHFYSLNFSSRDRKVPSMEPGEPRACFTRR